MPTDFFKKNILLVISVVLIVVAGVCFAFYHYSIKNNSASQQAPTGQNTNTSDSQIQTQLENSGIQYESTGGGGSLTVCQDKCGDGVCQTTQKNCKSTDISCACIETSKECPQDCK